MATQAIIGVVSDNDDDSTINPTIITTRSTTRMRSTDNKQTGTTPSITSTTNNISESDKNSNNNNYVENTDSPHIPARLSNIDKIAEVIRGQLLVRRNSDNGETTPTVYIDNKENIDAEKKLEKIRSEAKKQPKTESREFAGISI